MALTLNQLLAKNLRKELDDRGWSNKHAAKELGVGERTIANYCSTETTTTAKGKERSAKIYEVERIASKLKIDPLSLLEDPDAPAKISWPFPMVDQDRWEACSREERGFVQHALKRALEECERMRPVEVVGRAGAALSSGELAPPPSPTPEPSEGPKSRGDNFQRPRAAKRAS